MKSKIPSNRIVGAEGVTSQYQLTGRLRRVWLDYFRKCRNRNIEFLLKDEEFVNLIQSNCHYCGGGLSNISRNRKSEIKYNGIDRINNKIGYKIDNCVSCCKKCNSMKSNMEKIEFLSHVAKIYRHLERTL